MSDKPADGLISASALLSGTMMLPTHVLAGLAVATSLVALAPPEIAPAALAGAVLGSVLPDLDLYAGHRRTLHFPTGYVLAAGAVALGAALVPTPALAFAAFLLGGAALHCRMDRYGGGLELRPWERNSERAVYDHVRGHWRRPKRWIAYDGAPGDLAVAALLALPLLFVHGTPWRVLVSVTLVVGLTYALLRRRLATLAPTVVEYAPAPVREYVPDRYGER
jgi:hypothetical protein